MSRLGSEAILVLQVALEASAEAIMADMALLADNCSRQTIMPQDLRTLLVLRERWGDALFHYQKPRAQEEPEPASASVEPNATPPPARPSEKVSVKKRPAAQEDIEGKISYKHTHTHTHTPHSYEGELKLGHQNP